MTMDPDTRLDCHAYITGFMKQAQAEGASPSESFIKIAMIAKYSKDQSNWWQNIWQFLLNSMSGKGGTIPHALTRTGVGMLGGYLTSRLAGRKRHMLPTLLGGALGYGVPVLSNMLYQGFRNKPAAPPGATAVKGWALPTALQASYKGLNERSQEMFGRVMKHIPAEHRPAFYKKYAPKAMAALQKGSFDEIVPLYQQSLKGNPVYANALLTAMQNKQKAVYDKHGWGANIDSDYRNLKSSIARLKQISAQRGKQ